MIDIHTLSCDKCKEFIENDEQCVRLEVGVMGMMVNSIESWYHYSCYKDFTSPEEAVICSKKS